MARLTVDTYSQVLGTTQMVQIVTPDLNLNTQQPLHVLYLLHGLLDDQSSWLRQTRLESYLEGLPLVVVMPYAARSFYTNQKFGFRWRDWVETELPQQVENLLGRSFDRQHCHIAGLSMGGYGALKIGLSNPDRFSHLGSFSGAVALQWVEHERDISDIKNDLTLSFGNIADIEHSGDDLFHLVDNATPSQKIYVSCGTEDFLIEPNRMFHQKLQSSRLDFEYHELPGSHEWSFWDHEIQKFLSFLPLCSTND